MADLPYQTVQNVTGQALPALGSPERTALYAKYGVTAPAGSAEANLALQKAMLGGTNAIPTTAPAVSKPTAVITSGPAETAVSDAKAGVTDVLKQQADAKLAADTKTAADKAAAEAKATAEANKPKPTAAEQAQADIAATPENGQQWVYDTKTGERSSIAIGSAIPPGYTTTNVKVAGGNVAEGITIDFKQFPDGTYGRFDKNGNYQGQATQADFTQAQNAKQASDRIDQISAGNFILSPSEQAQIDSIKAIYAQHIKEQEVINANFTGATGIMAMRGGLGAGNLSGGEITNAINTGMARIADWNTQMNAAIVAATTAMKDGDLKALNDTWGKFTDLQKQQQAEITRTHDEVVAAKKAQADEAYRQQQLKDQEQVATWTEKQKPIDDLANEAAKNGASPELVKKIQSAGSLNEAYGLAADHMQDPTSPGGQYAAYVKSLPAGKSPVLPADYFMGVKIKEATAIAAANAAVKAQGDTKELNRLNDKLQKFATGGRTGAYGVESNKIDSALHAVALFNTYKQADGSYNIPTAQYTELGMSLANLISGTGTATESMRSDIKSATLKGDFNKVVQYIGGSPMTGNTQDIIKNLVDSVQRQGVQAENNRNSIIRSETALTTLDPSVSQRIVDDFTNKLPSVAHPDRNIDVMAKTPEQIAQDATTYVDNFIQNNKTNPDATTALNMTQSGKYSEIEIQAWLQLRHKEQTPGEKMLSAGKEWINSLKNK